MLLRLIQATPGNLSHCAEVLDPKYWGDVWPSFVAIIWKQAGGDVDARRAVVQLLSRWTDLDNTKELPPDCTILVDIALLAILDESPSVANHAAYAILHYAKRAHWPVDIQRIGNALQRMAVDPRADVRGAAAFAGTYLPIVEGVAEEIRAIAAKLDETLAKDPHAVIQRQRTFGKLEASAAS
jgi:hypothetical protein